MINYYDVLEVSEKASKEVIDKAYKILAKKYHPDLNQDNLADAEQKMKLLNEAYSILSDDNKRKNFDAILARKRDLEKQKNAASRNVADNDDELPSSNVTNKVSYSNRGYYTDDNNNFYVNTHNMDEKTKKKIQSKLQERYLEAYDAYLREHGYKLKYKWTFKRVMQLILAIIIFIFVMVVLFFIPPIHDFCIDLYEQNIFVKLIIDIFIALFNAIASFFRS